MQYMKRACGMGIYSGCGLILFQAVLWRIGKIHEISRTKLLFVLPRKYKLPNEREEARKIVDNFMYAG